jgi:hypothetical protein
MTNDETNPNDEIRNCARRPLFFIIRASSFKKLVKSQCSTQHPELTKIARHGAL